MVSRGCGAARRLCGWSTRRPPQPLSSIARERPTRPNAGGSPRATPTLGGPPRKALRRSFGCSQKRSSGWKLLRRFRIINFGRVTYASATHRPTITMAATGAIQKFMRSRPRTPEPGRSSDYYPATQTKCRPGSGDCGVLATRLLTVRADRNVARSGTLAFNVRPEVARMVSSTRVEAANRMPRKWLIGGVWLSAGCTGETDWVQIRVVLKYQVR